MFLNKVFKFLSGYVILLLNGLSIERFINICLRRNIKFIFIEKNTKDSARVAVYLKDFFKLRNPAFKTRTRIDIEKKCGLPFFIKKRSQRYSLLIGCLLISAVLFVGSQIVWIVDYDCTPNVDIEQLKAAVSITGLHPGVFKKSLLSGGEMKTIILSHTDNLSWAWVYIKGARAVVTAREAIQPPNVINVNVPCDIVAMCDGVVTQITAKTGIACAEVGNVVSAGDVLIAGTVTGENSMRLVHSVGSVRASCLKSVSGEYKLFKTVKKYNGNNKTLFTLTLFSKNINFFKKDCISDHEYDTIENSKSVETPLGTFGIKTVNLTGIDTMRVDLTPEEVEAQAQYELEEQISKTLTAGAILKSKSIRTEFIDSETVRVTLDAEFEQEIGLEKEIVYNAPSETP